MFLVKQVLYVYTEVRIEVLEGEKNPYIPDWIYFFFIFLTISGFTIGSSWKKIFENWFEELRRCHPLVDNQWLIFL